MIHRPTMYVYPKRCKYAGHESVWNILAEEGDVPPIAPLTCEDVRRIEWGQEVARERFERERDND